MRTRDLPIYELEQEIIDAVRTGSRLILQAPTGSGKSTQVPQILLEHGLAGDGEIVVLQPRRLATRMLAARVAYERGGRLGDEVGYQIRLDKVASRRTRIRFVTEGVLLRQMLADPQLRGVSAVVFDEFHERHLHGDITLARALDLQEQHRPDLRVIVMSATLEVSALESYLAPARLLTSRGRTFPVAMEYLARSAGDTPVWQLAAEELERVAQRTAGDVLVFMPGAYEINRTIQAIRESRAGKEFMILPLHGELPVREQDAAVARYERRKVIVSTNVAETSLTIEGVRVVIDSGLARLARFDPYRGINTLFVERISRASAEQRAGRAGRTAPGHCVRLWTEREHSDRAVQELPEVRRLDLAEVVLTLKASGVEDVARFRWLEAPDVRSLGRAETLLTDLGALTPGAAQNEPSGPGTSHITELGRRMLAFPAHPRYARMLLAAGELGCVPAIALVAALTQGRSLLRRAEGKQMQESRDEVLGESAASDFLLLMRAQRFAEQNNFDPQRCRPLGINPLVAREAAALTEQFLRIARDERLPIETRDTSVEALQRCVLAGFPDQVAMRVDTGTLRCQLVHHRRGVLARDSAVHGAPLLVASEVREIEGKDAERQVLLTLATAIEETWLAELFPGAVLETTEVSFDSAQRRVVARRIVTFRDLVLRAKESPEVPLDRAAAILAEQVAAGTCVLKHWDDAVEQWVTRLNLLADHFPDWQLPRLTREDRLILFEQICHGATSYREIKERAVWPVVKSWVSPAQQKLIEDYAPERIDLPNGRRARIVYADGAAPTVAVRIQDLYGVEGDLKIAGGRITLVIQVLAPNHRPIQVTQHLGNFWKESYPRLKQELQRKYPKHEWR